MLSHHMNDAYIITQSIAMTSYLQSNPCALFTHLRLILSV